MVCVGGQESPRMFLALTAHGVPAFRQQDPELSVGWISPGERARRRTVWDELDRRVGFSFDECRAGEVTHEPDPPRHGVHPYLFVSPSTLDRPIRNIVVAAS